MQALNSLKYNTYIWFKNKFFTIIFTSILLLVIGALIAISMPVQIQNKEPTPTEREEARLSYQSKLEKYQTLQGYITGEIAIPEGVLMTDGMVDYSREIEYYTFLLETDTYVAPIDSSACHFTKKFLFAVGLVFPLLVILFTYFLATKPSWDEMKNELISQMNRRSLFRGRILFIWLLLLVVSILLLLCPFISSLCDKSSYVCYGKDGYYCTSGFAIIFLPRALGLLLAAFIWSSTTFLCAKKHHARARLALPLSLYGATQAIFVLFYLFSDVIFNDERAVWYIDILAQMRYSERIGMFSNWPPIGQIGIGIMIFVTILLSVLCFFFYPRYAKMENEV